MRPIQMHGPGEWIAQRVDGWGRVESVAGAGFEAYARLLHPVPDHEAPAGRATDADHPWHTRRWAPIAAQHGKVMHPLVQWGRLVDPPDPYAAGSSVGWLDPEVLASLVLLLTRATTTPGDVIAGFWNGWGGLEISSPSSLTIPPGREFSLLKTSLTELADPEWGRQREIGWADGQRFPSAQILWPEDRNWVLASEIDWDSTIIAGPRSLIEDLSNDARFETFEVAAGDDLSWTGDTIN